MNNFPVHEYGVYIRCSSEQAWAALTDPAQTPHYYFDTAVESAWQVGEPIRYLTADAPDHVAADGEILAITEGESVEMTFHARWDPELDAAGPARMAWHVANEDGLTHVKVSYFDLDPEGLLLGVYAPGASMIVSGLKTWLETGTAISDPSRR